MSEKVFAITSQSIMQTGMCELSSFQLEDVNTFRPDIAIILNITPDHLDRYDYNIDLYAEAKMRIVKEMREEDTLIYNAMDPITVTKVITAQVESRQWSIRETDLMEDDKVFIQDDFILDMSKSVDGTT